MIRKGRGSNGLGLMAVISDSGTDSRVAIMSGKVSSVLSATMVIFKRMTSPSDLFPKNPRPKNVSDKEVRFFL